MSKLTAKSLSGAETRIDRQAIDEFAVESDINLWAQK